MRIFAGILTGIGLFGLFSELISGWILYIFSIPLVLPILFIIVGFIIFYQDRSIKEGIHIETFSKEESQVDAELISHVTDRGYKVKKDF